MDRRVSVILPNYNYAHYFAQRIDQILSQTYPVYEIIVLDDASTDNSLSVIAKKLAIIKAEKPNLKIITSFNESNSKNVFSQWQKGITLATGDYIWICELDDVTKPNFLATAMRGFDDPETVLSYTNSRMIVDNNHLNLRAELRNCFNFFRENRPKISYIRDGKTELKSVLAIYNTIPNVSAVVFKNTPDINYISILEQAKSFRLAGDWYFYSELLLHGKVAYFYQKLNLHRIHSSSVTESTDKKMRFCEIQKIHQKIAKDIALSAKTKRKIKKSEQKLRRKWHLT